jgi:very-short-patch-repair endonuclease
MKRGSSNKNLNMNEILTHVNEIPIRKNFIDKLPYDPKLKVLLKNKRKTGILSEVLFWMLVRARSFHKIDFDKQKIIGNYIVDFYANNLGLVVEIENSKKGDDKIKQEFLESLGLKVFKITDLDVKSKLTEVMTELENFIILHYEIPATPKI